MNWPLKLAVRKWRSNSIPDMSAILISDTMRSNSTVFARSRASSALREDWTSNPSFLRTISSNSRMDRSSSTTRIFAGLGISDVDGEHGSHTAPGLHTDRAVVGIHDLVHDRETQPRSFCKRRMKGHKKLLQFFLIHPLPGIFELNPRAAVPGLQADCQSTAIGHGSECICREVVEDLAHHAL